MDRPVAALDRRIELGGRPPFRVGNASVDPQSHEARFADRIERLQPQTIKVLIALVERSGQVVMRDELIERCWDGRYVGDDVINRSILLLRRFADQAGGFTIETIPKAGYRLNQVGRFLSRWRAPGIGIAVVTAIVALLLLLSAPWKAREPAVPTLALVSFTSGPEQETRDIAAASGEALSHMLLEGSYPPNLKWPATKRDQDGADLLLSGDVRQINGSFVAAVQLRDRASGTVIFSRRYEVDPAAAHDLPERIGAEMSSNLTGALAMLILDRRHPVGPDMAADMLKQVGMTVADHDPLEAYAVARRLADREPQSPLSQIALAFDTGFALGSLPRGERSDALRRGRQAADNALRLAPDFGDTHVPWCLLHSSVRIAECEDRMWRGMKADPDAPFVPTFLSSLLLNVGRNTESLELARASLADHPYQPHKLRRAVAIATLVGQTDYAESLFAKAIRWWPDHQSLYWDHVHGYALLGDMDGAERAIRMTPEPVRNFDDDQALAVIAAWRRGDSAGLDKACLAKDARYTSQMLCFGALAKFDHKDTAFQLAGSMFPRLFTGSPREDEKIWLDDPYTEPDPLLSSPAMKWLRSDPRYLPLAERMGLLAYWRTGRLPDFCTRDHEAVCQHFHRP